MNFSMKKITLLAMSFIMALTVKAQYGTDVTELLTNPDFENGTEGWTITGGGWHQATAASYGYNGTSFLENWTASSGNLADLDWSQTIEVPNGFYVVKSLAHSIKQSDESLVAKGVVIYANNDEVPVTTNKTNPPAEYIVTTVVTDGNLAIGYRIKSGNVNWTAWDNIRVYQYLAETTDEAKLLWVKDEMDQLAAEFENLLDYSMSQTLKDAISESMEAMEEVSTYAEADALWSTMKQQMADVKVYIFPAVKLYGKMEDIKAYLNTNVADVPYAVSVEVSDYMNSIKGYAVEGAYEDEEVNEIIIALDAKWDETLKAIDMFAEVKALADSIENELLSLDYPGRDELTSVLEGMAPYLAETSTVNTYANLKTLIFEVKKAIYAYHASRTGGYVLLYVVDDGIYGAEILNYGDEVILIDPTKKGYTFSGWSEAPETMPANDVNISGTFIINKYLVTFKIDDEVIATDSLEYGTVIIVPDAPEKEGHFFNGWGEVEEIVPANDLTYEGGYSINSYLLTYVIDGDTIKADSVAYGTEIIVIDEPAKPAKEGYTFCGWSEIPATMPAHDVVVNALFTKNKYKVTFKVGDEVISEEMLEYGSEIVAPNPYMEGHTFNGWGDVEVTVPAHDLTYEGSYSVKSYALIYKVDNKVLKKDTIPYGSNIVLIDDIPTKEGHSFSEWNVGNIGTTMPAHNVVINALFTKNKYRVTFALDGIVKKTELLEYGTRIEVPALEGYTLIWSEEVPETVPAKDVFYNATCVPNIYQVYYFVGSNLVYIADVAYGEKIPEYIYEPKEGEGRFIGWKGEIHETMPAHEVYFTAELGDIDTGIEKSEIRNEKSQIIYDLQGRRVLDVENMKAGLYIVNGHKVMIK